MPEDDAAVADSPVGLAGGVLSADNAGLTAGYHTFASLLYPETLGCRPSEL